MHFTLFLKMLAVIALFACVSVLFFRLREAASERVSTATQGLYIPPTVGAQSSTGGWELGRTAEVETGSRCVTISGHVR
jgi:hypothetical protein